MNKTKIWLLVALGLVIAGIGFASVGTAMGGVWKMKFSWEDFKVTKASDNYIDETKNVDVFTKIKVETSTVDIKIVEGSEYSVSYHVPEDEIPDIECKNGELRIKTKESSSFFLFNWSKDESVITVTIPSGNINSVDIESSTGDITVKDVSIYGKIHTSTGDIFLKGCKSDDDLQTETSTGDLEIEKCEFRSLNTEASTGEVKIKDSKIESKYDAKTSTGDIKVTSSTIGSFKADGSTSDITFDNVTVTGVKIETSTGDIKMKLTGSKDDYSIKLDSNTGDFEIDGNEIDGDHYESRGGNYELNIETSTGDIKISFK